MDIARPRDLADTLEIQNALEAFAARRAAQRGVSSAQTALLRQYTASMEEIAVAFGGLSADALEQYAEMSRRFHRLMVELAQCSMLNWHVADEFVSPFPFVGAQALTQARVEALRKFMLFQQDQHRSLIEAIAQRNSARPEALAQDHARFNQRFLAVWGTVTNGVFGSEPRSEPATPAVDVKTLPAKLSELTLTNDF
jgi:GntR family transcriptional regulator of vanillate catabolism